MFRLKLLLVTMTILIGAININVHAAESVVNNQNTQEKFVKEVGEAIRAIITDSGSSIKQKEDLFRSILKKYFNLESIAKFTLGKSRANATEADKAEFLQLFEDYLVKNFSDKFKDYADAVIEVTGHKEGSNGGVVVSSKVVKNEPLRVDWFVREKNGKCLVNDVIVEGVSLSNTQRSEFGGIVSKCGSVKGLNEELRKNISKNSNKGNG